jgi:hypothetical protein
MFGGVLTLNREAWVPGARRTEKQQGQDCEKGRVSAGEIPPPPPPNVT